MQKLEMITDLDFRHQRLEEVYTGECFSCCDFSDMVLEGITFDRCEFRQCRFSLTRFCSAALCDVTFVDCNMVGADFADVGRLSHGLVFRHSQLDYANFMAVRLHGTEFVGCRLTEACFDEADLGNSVFDDCDLSRSTFHRTDLQKVDFSTSFNFTINPNECHLRQTVFSESGLRGLVAHLDIEIC
jgi:uncharacterized protein YjbI with pentapeptide repeats